MKYSIGTQLNLMKYTVRVQQGNITSFHSIKAKDEDEAIRKVKRNLAVSNRDSSIRYDSIEVLPKKKLWLL